MEMLTAGSESLAITVVTMVPLTALGATMPWYTDWLNTGEKSFMSWRDKHTQTDTVLRHRLCKDTVQRTVHVFQ